MSFTFKDGSEASEEDMDLIAKAFGFGTWRRMQAAMDVADANRDKFGKTWTDLQPKRLPTDAVHKSRRANSRG